MPNIEHYFKLQYPDKDISDITEGQRNVCILLEQNNATEQRHCLICGTNDISQVRIKKGLPKVCKSKKCSAKYSNSINLQPSRYLNLFDEPFDDSKSYFVKYNSLQILIDRKNKFHDWISNRNNLKSKKAFQLNYTWLEQNSDWNETLEPYFGLIDKNPIDFDAEDYKKIIFYWAYDIKHIIKCQNPECDKDAKWHNKWYHGPLMSCGNMKCKSRTISARDNYSKNNTNLGGLSENVINKIKETEKKNRSRNLERRKQNKIERLKERFSEKNLKLVEYVSSNQVTFSCVDCDCVEQSCTLPMYQITERLKRLKDVCLHKNPVCSKQDSIDEQELREWISAILPDKEVTKLNKHEINRFELDVYIPDLKIGFEYCGLFHHSTKNGAPADRHMQKRVAFEEAGIEVFYVWSDDWFNKREKIQARIKSKLGITDRVIYARNTRVAEIKTETSREFLEENHLDGYANASSDKFSKIGLFHNDELVSVMTFSKRARANQEGHEIVRFASLAGTRVVGGAGKLINFYLNNVEVDFLHSYSRLDWGRSTWYEKLGFEKLKDTSPSYWYYHDKARYRQHRQFFMKHKLKHFESYADNKTEDQIMYEEGYYKIYDTGNEHWVLKVK